VDAFVKVPRSMAEAHGKVCFSLVSELSCA
jgi:hypothetical protein